MPVGDIKINSLQIGDMDLLNYNQVTYAGFNIYEDILNPYGVCCDLRVIDHSDALGKTALNGAYNKDITIKFSVLDNNKEASFKLKMFQNKNLDDQANKKRGSLHSKQYDIRGVSSELLNAQGNYVQKSYNDLTSNVIKDVLKNNFKTTRTIDIKEQTKGIRRLNFNNEHPLQVIQKLNAEHVSAQNESSTFVLFQQSDGADQKYVFSTFENLFKQGSVATIKQSAILATDRATEDDRRNSVIWINVGDSFFTPSRALSKSQEQTFNFTTHSIADIDPKQTNFTVADGSTSSAGVYAGEAQNAKKIPVNTTIDKVNNTQRHDTSTAKTKRSQFLSHLAQNSADLEIPGNPDIKLGSVITLQIPKKADSNNKEGELQFNGKALVVAIRHKIKPMGQTPRYTMILKVVKGSFKEGGGGSA